MQNQSLTVKTVEDNEFLKVKDLVEFKEEKPKTVKEEKTVRALVDLAYEFLDEDEKKRRRLAGYTITNTKNEEERPSKPASYKQNPLGQPVQYRDISAKKKESRIDPMKNISKGYFGLDFNALNEVKHEHGPAKKETNDHQYAEAMNQKHSVKDASYGKEMKHSNTGHFHADGTFHIGNHSTHGTHNHSEGKGSYSSHNCSNCGSGYVAKPIFRRAA